GEEAHLSCPSLLCHRLACLARGPCPRPSCPASLLRWSYARPPGREPLAKGLHPVPELPERLRHLGWELATMPWSTLQKRGPGPLQMWIEVVFSLLINDRLLRGGITGRSINRLGSRCVDLNVAEDRPLQGRAK